MAKRVPKNRKVITFLSKKLLFLSIEKRAFGQKPVLRPMSGLKSGLRVEKCLS
jgi:hypothetical protein